MNHVKLFNFFALKYITINNMSLSTNLDVYYLPAAGCRQIPKITYRAEAVSLPTFYHQFCQKLTLR